MNADYLIAFIIFLYIGLIYKNLVNNAHRVRRWSVRPINTDRKSGGYFQRVFLKMKEKDPEQFFIYSRMTRPIYDLLLAIMKDFLKKTSIREPISPEERLSITLLYLAHGVSHQALAWSFKIGKTTARNIILETCEALWQVLSPIYVSEPTQDQYQNIADEFEKLWNVPNCVGAIDGKHVSITCPKKSGSLYYNYKKFFSVVLMATCDAKYMFTSASIGSYGGHSDGSIFQTSEFGRSLLANKLPLPPKKPLTKSGIETFPFFFGDAAFPLKANLMRPFPGMKLTRIKRIYNYRLSRARRVIENAFGILVARWRILRVRIECYPENVEKIVLASIALHNFIMLNDHNRRYCPPNFVDWESSDKIVHDGDWHDIVDEDRGPLRSIRTFMHNAAVNAFQLRNSLANYLVNEGAVSFQDKVVQLMYGPYE